MHQKMTMYTLQYSQHAKVIRWDSNSWTDCRPCEADAIQDEIIELAEDLIVKPKILRDVKLGSYKNLLITSDLQKLQALDWSLEKANEEAKRICSAALAGTQGGFDNLQHAKTVCNEYEEEGRELYPKMQLDKPEEQESWEKEEPLTIGFGDEEVTDANCSKKDETVSYKVSSMHFADPYGCEAFNVVELVIKVEVVPSSETKKKQKAGEKRKL